MKILVCNDNYTSFLSAVYAAFYYHKNAMSITSNPDKPMLMDQVIQISDDIILAKKVHSGIAERYGRQISEDIYQTYLADYDDKENIIFDFIKLLAKYGKNAAQMYQIREVMDFYNLNQKVLIDARRMIQFIRLQQMKSGVYYAPFNSDHDVIEVIITHFKARFNTLEFVLHDLKRGKMIYYDTKACHYGYAPENLVISLSDEEKSLRPIWKNYVKNIAVEGRTNKKVQDSFMPHRYRTFMYEFFDDE